MQLMFWTLISLWYFGGSFVWVAFQFFGEWQMSLIFEMDHFLLSGQLQTNFLNTYTVQGTRYLSVWTNSRCWDLSTSFVLGALWNAEVCF